MLSMYYLNYGLEGLTGQGVVGSCDQIAVGSQTA